MDSDATFRDWNRVPACSTEAGLCVIYAHVEKRHPMTHPLSPHHSLSPVTRHLSALLSDQRPISSPRGVRPNFTFHQHSPLAHTRTHARQHNSSV
ncbi:unnamed protein product [Protopolystoma xenopodis]|uniref:Uncharacterized protein n=1 Tax=Protopolystoma xenopodis TaxID=117903 RepID=A0A3S5B0N6_9PLAT|nr:unnamed protein product [Protopolystoma xenopodis]